MKKTLSIVFACTVSFLSLCSCVGLDDIFSRTDNYADVNVKGYAVPTMEDATAYIGDEYMHRDDVDIWISNEPFPSRTDLQSVVETVTTPNGWNWLIFIDYNFHYLWTHECLYRFVNAKTGDVTDVTARIAPSRLNELYTHYKWPVIPDDPYESIESCH